MDISLTSADGTHLAARRTGRGAPLVLVHGSAGGLGSWDPVRPLLEDDFELWFHARRGYAPSALPTGPKTFADDVADLRAVLTAVGRPATVFGASYGALVALHAAQAGGAGISSLVLFEPPLFAAGAAAAPLVAEFRALLDAGEVGAASTLFTSRVARVPATVIEALGPPRSGAREAAEAVGCLHDLEALAADPPGRWSPGVPVLLVQGGDTWAPMPATLDALAGALPDVTRVVLPGQSHFATHTAPELVAAAVREFHR